MRINAASRAWFFMSVAMLAVPVCAQAAPRSTDKTPARQAVPALQTRPQAQPTSAPEMVEVRSTGIVSTGARSAAKPMQMSNSPLSDIAMVSHFNNEEIRRTPVHVTADLLRSVPGFQVDDYQDGGIAQGIGARGWSSESDGNYIATFIDGSIRNVYSGILNGYNDLNPLIPELLGGMTVISGPFDARYGGNYASAGSIIITTRDYVGPGISVTGGSFGRARALVTLGRRLNSHASIYTAVEGLFDSGYRRNSVTRRINSFTKFVDRFNERDTLRVTAQAYITGYGQPYSIPLSYIQSGRMSERDPRSYIDRGANDQYTLNGQFEHVSGNFTLDANVFVNKTWLTRSTTTGLPGTTNVQHLYLDDRYTVGATVDPYWKFRLPNGGSWDFKVGAGTHVDFARNFHQLGENNVAYTAAVPGYYGSFLNMNRFTEIANGAYASTSISPLRWIKMTGGMRYDDFMYSVNDTRYGTGGISRPRVAAHTGAPSIKAALAINPVPFWTGFLNYGQSITSPDANTDIPVNSTLQPSKLGSEEAGMRFDYKPLNAHIQGSAYVTIDSNEIGFNQATLTQANLGKSHRSGYDADGAITLIKSKHAIIDLQANYNWVRARLVSTQTSFIPNVADWMAGYGVHATFPITDQKAIDLNVTHQFIGPQPLNSARTYTAPQYQRIATRVSYTDARLSNMRIWLSGIVFPGNRFAEDEWISGSTIYTAPQPRLTLEGGFSFGL